MNASVKDKTASKETMVSDVMPKADQFSKWYVAVRTVANVQQWLTINIERRLEESFPFDELRAAATLWIQAAQAEVYQAELKDLTRGRVSRSSHIYRLNPVLVDGIICADSRLKRSNEIDGFAQFPPILPKKHPYTLLLV